MASGTINGIRNIVRSHLAQGTVTYACRWLARGGSSRWLDVLWLPLSWLLGRVALALLAVSSLRSAEIMPWPFWLMDGWLPVLGSRLRIRNGAAAGANFKGVEHGPVGYGGAYLSV